jgi:hypothetical protein
MVRAVASVGLMLLLLAVFLVSLLGLVAVVLSIRIGWQRREKREGIVPLEEPGEGMVSDVDLIRRAAGDALDRLADRPSAVIVVVMTVVGGVSLVWSALIGVTSRQ